MPGVPDELVPHIFERSFSGAHRTGLGLALARDLVAADGGRLELAQPRPPIFAIFLRRDPIASTGASDDGGCDTGRTSFALRDSDDGGRGSFL